MPMLDRTLAIAPMMDWTDRHCRYFLRQISPNAVLYTEMVTTGAIIHGDRERLLKFDDSEHPVAIQLGGSDPKALAECAVIAQDWGYAEINLNIGCPSDRVQNGQFGLCLLKHPAIVAEAVAAIKAKVTIPVTVKTRIGVDDIDDYEHLHEFTQKLIHAGCDYLWVHARKGWLKGLSPKENRVIPPLDYERVYQLKSAFPQLGIGINGGIETVDDVQQHLNRVDGVMLGRAAYHNPYILAELETRLFNTQTPPTRAEIIDKMKPYIEAEIQSGTYLKNITRHMLGLYQGQPGAKHFRRTLSENAHLPSADFTLLSKAIKLPTP